MSDIHDIQKRLEDGGDDEIEQSETITRLTTENAKLREAIKDGLRELGWDMNHSHSHHDLRSFARQEARKRDTAEAACAGMRAHLEYIVSVEDGGKSYIQKAAELARSDSPGQQLLDQLAKAKAALKAIKIRIHFIGMPQEKLLDGGLPDWSKEIELIESALAAWQASKQPTMEPDNDR